jgi:hypothetical protein
MTSTLLIFFVAFYYRTEEEATEEKAPAPRLSAARQRRAKRNAEAESKAENAESMSVGPRWGASARRGPTDKRKRIKEKVIVIEAEDRTDVISFGEVAAGKQLWYLLQVSLLIEEYEDDPRVGGRWREDAMLGGRGN